VSVHAVVLIQCDVDEIAEGTDVAVVVDGVGRLRDEVLTGQASPHAVDDDDLPGPQVRQADDLHVVRGQRV